MREDKDLILKLLPTGKFQVESTNMGDKVNLSEVENVLYHYYSFINVADFWDRADRIRNIFSVKKPSEQPVSLALAISESILKGKGAWRVHGGGFAGTVQAYVPAKDAEGFVTLLESVFGKGSCYLLHVRPSGAVKVF